MEVLRKSRELIRYSALAVILALGAGACSLSGDGEPDEQGLTTTSTIPAFIDEGDTNFSLSASWEVSDVQYLGLTDYYEDSVTPESDQFMVTYENDAGNELECLYVRPYRLDAGVTVSCNWPAYNEDELPG
jgi:hypothetical protein